MADQAKKDEPQAGGTTASSEAAPRSTAAARLAAKRAAKAAAKASRKGTAPIVPSAVVEGVDRASSWYDAHGKTLWAVGLLLGLGAIAWLAIGGHVGKTASEAAELLGAGVKTAQALVVAEGETAPDDAEDTYPTARDRAQKALDEYRAVLKKFPDSAAASWAKLGEANTLQELRESAEAEKAYSAALERGRKRGDSFLQWRALEGLGFALEAQGKHGEAAARFEEIAALSGGAYKVPGEYHRARMLVAQGKKAEAASLLEALVKGERARPSEQRARFEGVIADAETLQGELATELGTPKLEPKLPAAPETPGLMGGGLQGQNLPPELMEMLQNLKLGEESGATGDAPGAAPGDTPSAPPEGEAP